MVTTTATIQNAYGIHCRPSGVIAKAVQGYTGKIQVVGPDGKIATPTSVLSILSLGLTAGDTVTINVTGPDEATVAKTLKDLFSKHYDFKR